MKHSTENLILDYYYKHVYSKIWKDNLVLGFAEKFMEKLSPKEQKNVLEIGGGAGEHLQFVKVFPMNEYISFDKRYLRKEILSKLSSKYSKVRFVKGSIEKISFPDNYFDHIKSTCVLAHVNNLLACCLEIRRVATDNCTIIILLPTDPGVMNMLVKKLITYPKINSISRYPAGLIYSLDHKNSHNNILEVIKYVFRQDKIEVKYLPFFLKSLNLNLFSLVRITVTK